MPIISIRIPQLGEGLQEALLVEFIKQPGDRIKRDDTIYVMETDKATTDVESPYDGTLVEWTVQPGTVLEIGAEIGKIEVADGVKEMAGGHGPAETAAASSSTSPASHSERGSLNKPSGNSGVMIPPKTRKYLKEKGLLDSIDQIPVSGKKMMPEDVDAFLSKGGVSSTPTPAGAAATPSEFYEIQNLPQSQITLNYRLVRGTQVCVPVTVMCDIDWTRLDEARKAAKQSGGPTAFSMALWCVTQALKKHSKFRSVMAGDGRALKVYHRVNLGVAVALPGDEMVTAVVRNADQMDQPTFFAALANQIEIARNGKDQADESTTVTVSNIGKAGMKFGIPAIVAPAVATLAMGETYSQPVPDGDSFKFRPTVTAVLSFDHRIANGVGAANFMNDVRTELENYQYSS